jgi:hypothetical protein
LLLLPLQPSGAVTLADSPRFGHSTDISRLVSNDDAERSDYINGLVLAASLTAICFAVAMLVVAILRATIRMATTITIEMVGTRREDDTV